MRDPWFPLLIILIVLLRTWLGIFGPMPHGFTEWLHGWQTLIAASVALGAAYVAYWNTNRSLAHAKKLEADRRESKLTALRAMLPLALAQICEYAYRTAQSLNVLIAQCVNEVLPFGTIKNDFVKSLPSDTLRVCPERSCWIA